MSNVTLVGHIKTKRLYTILITLYVVFLRQDFAQTYLKSKGKLFLCLTNEALCHEGVWGSGYIDPHCLDISTSWR
jgi:hypothetical protein